MLKLNEVLKFVRIDDSFYTVLKEYEQTKNKKLVLEKIFEAFFKDYDAIEVITGHFKDKKALDFFVGDKNIDVFKNIRGRIDAQEDHYKFKDFILGVLFESKYTDSKIHSILYELDHVIRNSRNSFSSSEKHRNVGKTLKEHIAAKVSRDLKKGDMNFSVPGYKWMSLLVADLDTEARLALVKSSLEVFEALKSDAKKNQSKIVTIRTFLSSTPIRESMGGFHDSLKWSLAKFFKFVFDEVEDYKSGYGEQERMFGEGELYSVLTSLYAKDVPDNVYELVFESAYREGIPALKTDASWNRRRVSAIHNNLHLISDKPLFLDYARKAFEDSFKFMEYYQDIREDLEAVDLGSLTRFTRNDAFKEIVRKGGYLKKYPNVGSSYQGNAVLYNADYPLFLKGGGIISLFFKMYGEGAYAHFDEVLRASLKNVDFLTTDSEGSPVCENLINAITSGRPSNPDELDSLLDYVQGVLEKKDFGNYAKERVSRLYSFFLGRKGLLLRKEEDGRRFLVPNKDESFVRIAKDFQSWNKKEFDAFLEKGFDYSYKEASREMFLTYYSFEDLKSFPERAATYFVEDAETLDDVLGVMGGEFDSSFVQSLISRTVDFFPDVLDVLLGLSKGNVDNMTSIAAAALRKHPQLVGRIREAAENDEAVRDEVFNLIMENIDKHQDPKSLPYNIPTMDNDKRLEGLSILEGAIRDLFSVKE